MSNRLAVSFAGMDWDNPLTVASGMYVPWGRDMPELPLAELGAVTCKSVSVEAWPGNAKPWFADLGAGLGMLNAIGIRNPGIDTYLHDHTAELVGLGRPLIQSLAAVSLEDFRRLAARFTQAGIFAALELNMSCPNTDLAQIAFGQSPEAAYELVHAVRGETNLPVIAKLTPNAGDVPSVARACAEGGAAALTLINTVLAMDIDVKTGLPRTGIRTAGLSGPAILPLALRIVWDVFEAVDLPIIGVGGIGSAEDALKFILAGATAVAVGTAAVRRPEVMREVITGLEAACTERGVGIQDLVGLSHRLWAERAQTPR
ncbi:MAG TPA: dihydroorotate dehydrogenase [Bacillota bacterium]|nr:dihydroorotate dehydrogenase [Bacillota bacterium]